MVSCGDERGEREGMEGEKGKVTEIRRQIGKGEDEGRNVLRGRGREKPQRGKGRRGDAIG